METSLIYKIINEANRSPDNFSNKLFEKTDIIPMECYQINDGKNLFLKIEGGTNSGKINKAHTIKILKELGLELKLSSDQAERNTIFVTTAPESIYTTSEGEPLEKINKDNPNIFALSLFVPPPKGHRTRQTLGPIKLLLLTKT